MTLVCALFLLAAEEVVLHTGFRLPAERHEVVGESLVLHTASGTVEIPKASVASIEKVESAAVPAPAGTGSPVARVANSS